jgi:threonine/homoserine/homoserine lactone efflux protein
MIHALFSGVAFGLVLTILLGPGFFGLLQTSINKGFKYGMMFALGVALSDLIFIFLTYYGISSFLEIPAFKKGVGIAGGVLMCVFGMFYFFKPVANTVPFAQIQKETHKIAFVIKGFLLNIFNPSVLFFWIGIVSVISVKYDDNQFKIFGFFAAAVITVLGIDILKSYIANKIKVYFTNKVLNVMNKVVGMVLCGIGLSLLYTAFTGHSIH